MREMTPHRKWAQISYTPSLYCCCETRSASWCAPSVYPKRCDRRLDARPSRWVIILMELSFVKKGLRSGGLGRLVSHAANACLTLNIRRSETRRHLDFTLDWEAFAISRLYAPVLSCRAKRIQRLNFEIFIFSGGE